MPTISLICDVYSKERLVEEVGKQLGLGSADATGVVNILLGKEVAGMRLFLPVHRMETRYGEPFTRFADVPLESYLLNIPRGRWEFVDIPAYPRTWRWGTLQRWVREGYPEAFVSRYRVGPLGGVGMGYYWSGPQLEQVSMAGALIATQLDWRDKYRRVALGRYRFDDVIYRVGLETRIGVEYTFDITVKELRTTWQGKLTWKGGSGTRDRRKYDTEYEITVFLTGAIPGRGQAEDRLVALLDHILQAGPSMTGVPYPSLDQILSPTEYGGWHDADFQVEKLDREEETGDWFWRNNKSKEEHHGRMTPVFKEEEE